MQVVGVGSVVHIVYMCEKRRQPRLYDFINHEHIRINYDITDIYCNNIC